MMKVSPKYQRRIALWSAVLVLVAFNVSRSLSSALLTNLTTDELQVNDRAYDNSSTKVEESPVNDETSSSVVYETNVSAVNETNVFAVNETNIADDVNKTNVSAVKEMDVAVVQAKSAYSNTEVESTAKATDPSAVDEMNVSDNNPSADDILPHPFAGARHANGSFGYVADVTKVRQHMRHLYHHFLLQVRGNQSLQQLYRPDIDPIYSFLPFKNSTTTGGKGRTEFEAVCNTHAGYGHEKLAGYDLVMRRIQVNGPDPPAFALSNTSLFVVDTKPIPPEQQVNARALTPRPRILCVVYTHDKVRDRIDGITATWGWRCDGFLAASTITVTDPAEPGFGSVDLPHEGEEGYNNMWSKTRSIAAYLYTHYLNDYDYFYVSGDDTHLIVENLRNYLILLERELKITRDYSHKAGARNRHSSRSRTHDTFPLYLGHSIPIPLAGRNARYLTYAGGGPGYILNRAALKRFAERAVDKCYANTTISAEDRLMGICLSTRRVLLHNTADAQNRQRFHGMDPKFIATYDGGFGRNGRLKYMERLYRFWAVNQKLGHKAGHDLVSTQSVSLHIFKTPVTMKRIHALLYRSCPLGTLLGNAQLEWDEKVVPTPLDVVLNMSLSEVSL